MVEELLGAAVPSTGPMARALFSRGKLLDELGFSRERLQIVGVAFLQHVVVHVALVGLAGAGQANHTAGQQTEATNNGDGYYPVKKEFGGVVA